MTQRCCFDEQSLKCMSSQSSDMKQACDLVADELAAGGGARMLSTAQFLKDVGTAGGFRKQVTLPPCCGRYGVP